MHGVRPNSIEWNGFRATIGLIDYVKQQKWQASTHRVHVIYSLSLALSLPPHYCSPTNLFLTYSNYVVYCENTRCVELHTMKAPS